MAVRLPDDEDDTAPISDINVTPLVDVMLVLLIIFMVAAPLMAIGVPVDLPKTHAQPLQDRRPPLVVSLNEAGHLFLGAEEVPAEGLIGALDKAAEGARDRRIHLRADRRLAYGRVFEVMSLINRAGYTKGALVSEEPK